jgi:hypothetical protein
MGEIPYEDFVYNIKRYTYKGQSLNDKILEELCPALNLDYSSFQPNTEDKSS